MGRALKFKARIIHFQLKPQEAISKLGTTSPNQEQDTSIMEMFKYDDKEVSINVEDAVMVLRNLTQCFMRTSGVVSMEQVQNFVGRKFQTSVYSSHAKAKGNGKSRSNP